MLKLLNWKVLALIFLTAISVIADTYLPTEQILLSATDNTAVLQTLLIGPCEFLSNLFVQCSSAVTNRGWIKLLGGKLLLIGGSVVLTVSIPLCTEAISTERSHFQLLLGLSGAQ